MYIKILKITKTSSKQKYLGLTTSLLFNSSLLWLLYIYKILSLLLTVNLTFKFLYKSICILFHYFYIDFRQFKFFFTPRYKNTFVHSHTFSTIINTSVINNPPFFICIYKYVCVHTLLFTSSSAIKNNSILAMAKKP